LANISNSMYNNKLPYMLWTRRTVAEASSPGDVGKMPALLFPPQCSMSGLRLRLSLPQSPRCAHRAAAFTFHLLKQTLSC
jgi:hypothetical protein